ncbi:glycosyltransferase [Jannaschia pohangensis]|uniref:UDP:flavonoid glycosyltransferase YjiC, YdhE family n=1 Tax=Jannaschia pohangensis TaxID=390807 RepID=A0A1I3I508_9RHOB|nr:glycosyltransferase [Jannaschia pohangensis]SFI43002.1 UDP:flavonoid glycosyltransferase YjiC, YdhE family [Jannaschia pohangensis]
MTTQKRTPPLQWRGVSRLPGLEGRIPKSDRGAVVLATLGSLGDLYPVLSVARALEGFGVEVRLALSPDDCDMARRWGLLATPVGPSEAEGLELAGMTRDELAADVLRDPGRLLNRTLIPLLPDITRQMDELCVGAACVAGTAFALGAPLAAERADLPFVPLVLQPMLTFSADDPPVARGFGLTIKDPQSDLARRWNRGQIALARTVLRLRHQRPLNRARAALDLPQSTATPLMDPAPNIPFRLGLWSRHFSPLPRDRREGWHLTGFPPAPNGDLSREVQDWIDAGPAPLVVTLGSIAQNIAGPNFWDEAVRLARGMGLRAVLLHGEATVPTGPDILALPYAAHGPLFPQAAAILHHGGIGTTAEAIRSGRPQLVLPVGGDQPDNAARLVRLGLAATVPAKSFRADKAIVPLRALLDRFDYAKAADLGTGIRIEDGARQAALHLAGLVNR